MSAQPKQDPVPLHDGDDGPVAENVPGFDDLVLAQAEEDEELFALEHDDDVHDDAAELPDEAHAEPAAAATVLTDQPTRAPGRKVKAAGIGGLLAAVPVSLIAAMDTITVPEQWATTITAALTLAGALAAAYLAREKRPERRRRGSFTPA